MSEQASGKAIASLVLAILAWAGVCPCVGALLAVILGMGERSGVGRAGFLLGLLHLLVFVVLLVLGFVVVAGATLVRLID